MNVKYFDQLCGVCGTDVEDLYGWCKVCQATALVLFAERALRWGIQMATLAWALRLEWTRYRRSQPLVQVLQTALPGRTGFKAVAIDRLLILATGLFFSIAQLCSQSASFPLANNWILTVTACIFYSFLPLTEHTVDHLSRLCVYFKGLDQRWHYIAYHSTEGPFYFGQPFRPVHEEKEFATIDELTNGLKNSKRN